MKLPAYSPGAVQPLTAVSPDVAAAPFAAQASVGGKVNELADKLFNELQDRRDEIETQQLNLRMAETDKLVGSFEGMDYIPLSTLREHGVEVDALSTEKINFDGVEEDAVASFKVFPQLQRKLRLDALDKAKKGISYEPLRRRLETEATAMIDQQTGRALVTARDQAEAMQQRLAVNNIKLQAARGDRAAVDETIELLNPEDRKVAKMQAYQIMLTNLATTADDVRLSDKERIELYKQVEAMGAEFRDVVGDEVATRITQSAAENKMVLNAYVNDVFPRWKGGGGTKTKDQLAAEAPYKMNTPEYKAYVAAVSRLPDEPDPEELRKRYSGGRWVNEFFADDLYRLRKLTQDASPTDKARWEEVDALKKAISQKYSILARDYPGIVPSTAEALKQLNDAMSIHGSFGIGYRQAGDPQFAAQIFSRLDMLDPQEQATLIGENMDMLKYMPTGTAAGLLKIYQAGVQKDKTAGAEIYKAAAKEGDIEVVLDTLGYSRKTGEDFLSDVKERSAARLTVQGMMVNIYSQASSKALTDPVLARRVRDDARKAFTESTFTVAAPLVGTTQLKFSELADDFEANSPQHIHFLEQIGVRASRGQPLRNAIAAAYADAKAYKPKSTGALSE